MTVDRLPDDCFSQVIVSFTDKKQSANNTIEVDVFAIGRRK